MAQALIICLIRRAHTPVITSGLRRVRRSFPVCGACMWPRAFFEHSTLPLFVTRKRFLTEPLDLALGMGSILAGAGAVAALSGVGAPTSVPRSQARGRAPLPGAAGDPTEAPRGFRVGRARILAARALGGKPVARRSRARAGRRLGR